MKHKSEQKDYYGILGVPADAKDKAIKKAYHKLSYAAYLLVSGRTFPISTL